MVFKTTQGAGSVASQYNLSSITKFIVKKTSSLSINAYKISKNVESEHRLHKSLLPSYLAPSPYFGVSLFMQSLFQYKIPALYSVRAI